MMIKCIIVDDEWYNLEEISKLVAKTGFMSVEGKYQNPVRALEEVTVISPQVAFIDIGMLEMDGITLAEKLMEKEPSMRIVFITAWDQYAIQAFDLNALDYVMKPIKLERFQRMAAKIQKEVQLKVSLQSSSDLKIKCFDQLEVSIGDNPVKWERAKAEELFAYLLMNHGRYIHKDTIIQDLWPGYEYAKALAILQTSICKIRSVFSRNKREVTLNFNRGKYCLSISRAECDYLEAEKVLSQYKTGDKAVYEAVEKACKQFAGGFLPRQGYVWSLEKDEELRRRLALSLKEIMAAYLIEGNNVKVLRVLKLLAGLEPYDEEINCRLLALLADQGDYRGVTNHYQWLTRILREEYGTVPSAQIIGVVNSFYDQIK
ncbi:response regulator containing CheY-like receiver and SARP domains [Desulfosporosinus acidiphilus SJ4]|uniref:Stage 0 sporulation protein A homolog n=1 Tax=Desulfosporosinus acidiphilus (strain DSM 22704 / JCM 16185 / SJ4) TaxID=646529 RepID=I4DC16_DESAJ|nr:response regulator [Desulfosporosinus acidiphilus]AFM43340.1 response regulator containing CheY-like receiver and SARP domains [Desulfosporosinus acidiphilus SJ4]